MATVLSVAAASDVIDLTDADFESKTKDHDMMLIEFFAPWCGHCKRLAPEYEIAATKLKKNDPPVALAKVDCTEAGKESCSKFGVTGYPTLKVFRNGKFSQEYDGPRQADGIVNHLKKQAGPASKEYTSLEKLKQRMDNADENLVVGFFTEKDNSLHKVFDKASGNKRNDFNFAHTFAPEILQHFKYENAVVLFRPPHLHAKFEESAIAVPSDVDETVLNIERFLDDNQFGLVGQMHPDSEEKFLKPVITAYYDIDWVRNKKGSRYWRNRVARVAKKFKEQRVTFSIASKGEYSRSFDDWKLDTKQDVLAAAKNEQGEVFLMQDEFSVENFEKFANDFMAGKIKPYIKSEPIPENNDGPVKVVVGENFKDIVLDETKDVLIEMYAPWCGHCKSLEPKYTELGEKLKNVKDIVIAKMDATANSAHPSFSVTGFPTIYWAPMGNKKAPKKYQGGREVSDFIEFLKQESTNPFELSDEEPKKKKKKKAKKQEL